MLKVRIVTKYTTGHTANMKVLCAVALCVALQHAAAEVDIEDDYGPEAKVLELTDADFERETQASTGATTGNWFVMFHAPWCGWCKRLSPDWDKLAKKMKGEIVVAKVDATANQLTSARFGIQFFPTLVFLRQGKMYKYDGAKDLAAFEEFATAGYAKAEALPVPAEVGLIGAYWKMIVSDVSVCNSFFLCTSGDCLRCLHHSKCTTTTRRCSWARSSVACFSACFWRG